MISHAGKADRQTEIHVEFEMFNYLLIKQVMQTVGVE